MGSTSSARSSRSSSTPASRAAETCTWPPTVSFQIRALEESLGTRLLDRGPHRLRRVRLTSAGRAFHAYAERLLALRREAEARVRAGEGLEAGELRVAASTIPGEYLLPGWLARFRELHPAVAIAVRVADSDEAIDDVRAGRADLGAVGKRARDPRLLFTPLGEDEILLVAAPSLRVRRAEPDDLRRLPLVARERGSGTRRGHAGAIAPFAIRASRLTRQH